MQKRWLTVNPGTLPDSEDIFLIAKAPAAANGGGFTVLEAVVNTGAVGTLNIELRNMGASGTVLGGTVAAMANGTATTWAANVPQALAVTAAQQYIDAGEYLYGAKVEAATGNDLTEDATISILIVDGVADVG